MNENEITPILTETLIETIFDNIKLDENDNSDYLKLQYENSSKEKKEAMDVVMMCLTGQSLNGIMAVNDKRNKTNYNVG